MTLLFFMMRCVHVCRDTRPRVSGVAGLRYGRTPQERCPYGEIRDVGGFARPPLTRGLDFAMQKTGGEISFAV